jgi:hypothetical protein
MPYSITFEDYTPPPKHDGLPWTEIHIEEALFANGPWTEIDVQPIVPLDEDPTEPMARAFTTDNATVTNGWYQIIFHDVAASTAVPTEPIQNIPDETMPYLPTLADVAAIMRARTKTVDGDEIGTFNDETRPTGEQVNRIIIQASSDVTALVDTDIPEGAYRYAKQAIIYRTAKLIEISYFPEQIATGRSPYPEYNALFDEALTWLQQAVGRETEEETMGENILPGQPFWTFPGPEVLVGWRTRM